MVNIDLTAALENGQEPLWFTLEELQERERDSYDSGFREGRTDFEDELDQAWQDGYDEGWTEGYQYGKEELGY